MGSGKENENKDGDREGRIRVGRKREEDVYFVRVHEISSGDKTGRTSDGRCEFRMDVTAIRTSFQPCWKVHVLSL